MPLSPLRHEDLEAVAGRAPLVTQIQGLAAWAADGPGGGRKLTQTGRIGLADARHLVSLLQTGDVIDAVIGGRTFKTKSSEELSRLTLVVEWAKAVRLVRVTGSKLVPVKKNAVLAEKPLDLVIKLVETYPKLGQPLFPRGHWRSSLVGDEFSDLAPEFLTGLLRMTEPLPLTVLSEMATVLIESRYVLSGLRDAQLDHLRHSIEADVRIAMSALHETGVVTLARNSDEVTDLGYPVWDKATAELTPLGRYVIRRLRGMPAAGDPVLTLRVTLDSVDSPPVWRMIVIPASFSLARVHQAIQAAMGWHDSHLHDFRIGDRLYGASGWLHGEHDFKTLDEVQYRLGDLVKPGDTFVYQYDFGDSWEHTVTVKSAGSASADVVYPHCADGSGACPPEDCGGAPGFADLKATLAGPPGPERDELLAWAGGDYDPERFSLVTVNGRLAAV